MSDFESDVRAIHAAGQGAMTLTVVGPASAASIINAVMEGDSAARVVLSAADRLLRRVQRRTRGKAMPCFLCGGELWSGEAPAAVGVLTPYGIDCVRTAIGFGFCSACASDCADAELAQAAVLAFRAGMMPDLRVLPAMAHAGHA